MFFINSPSQYPAPRPRASGGGGGFPRGPVLLLPLAPRPVCVTGRLLLSVRRGPVGVFCSLRARVRSGVWPGFAGARAGVRVVRRRRPSRPVLWGLPPLPGVAGWRVVSRFVRRRARRWSWLGFLVGPRASWAPCVFPVFALACALAALSRAASAFLWRSVGWGSLSRPVPFGLASRSTARGAAPPRSRFLLGCGQPRFPLGCARGAGFALVGVVSIFFVFVFLAVCRLGGSRALWLALVLVPSPPPSPSCRPRCPARLGVASATSGAPRLALGSAPGPSAGRARGCGCVAARSSRLVDLVIFSSRRLLAPRAGPGARCLPRVVLSSFSPGFGSVRLGRSPSVSRSPPLSLLLFPSFSSLFFFFLQQFIIFSFVAP